MAGSIGGPERRIVLVGKREDGKSATGSTILGSQVFESGMSWKSRTQICHVEEAQLKGGKVVVVDTPGFVHTDRPDEHIAAEVRKCVRFCSPGPHAILHVMNPFRFFLEETDVAQWITEVLSQKAKNYTILLFTCKDQLQGVSLGGFISSRDENLKEYIAECGSWCLFFNNRAKGEEREAQVAELMTMIDALVERNRDAPCYTEDMMNVSQTHNL